MTMQTELQMRASAAPNKSERPGSDQLRQKKHRQSPVAWAMQLPGFVVLGLIVVFPLIYSINLSLRKYSLVIPGRTGQWAGLENYRKLLHDSDFGAALITTTIFVVAAVTLETVLGTFVGILLDRLVRLRRTVTSILLLPMIVTPLIVGLMFNFAFNAQFGYVTWALNLLGVEPAGGLLNRGPTALAVLILVDVWEWLPFIALMVMAGLRALPSSPFEAASIDGASTWQTYRYIMLPMLKPVLGVAILFRATEAIREFDKVYVLTGGGPGSATTVNDLYQYRVSFLNWDLSYGAALGMTTFVAVLLVCGVVYRVITRMEVRS
jgi:multiple sugar transport system permease protein